MSATTTILPSKVMQLDGWNVLCEDGSVWQMSDPNQQVKWTQLHPPHQPSTQSDDFKESLYWLDLLWHNPENHEVLGSVLAFLRKHGRVK